MGVGAKTADRLGRAADAAVAKGMAPKITMTAYARKPGPLGAADE
jgi:hypothetical protein